MLDRTDPARIRIECLEEEIRQLKEHIAKLEGRALTREVRRAFGFTDAEASIFCLLYRLRFASYELIERAIYEPEKAECMEWVGGAIRSHMKRMRQKTRPHGVDFHTIYSLGFEMDEASHATAARILQRLEAA